MAHSIFFYTGTGNSLWVARKLGLLLNAEEPIAIHRYKNGPVHVDTEGIGLVFLASTEKITSSEASSSLFGVFSRTAEQLYCLAGRYNKRKTTKKIHRRDKQARKDSSHHS